VVATAANFVLSYKSVEAFANNYKLDKQVIGEGKVLTDILTV